MNNKEKMLVINWHLTEVCNYSCDYCYAKWKKDTQPRELIHNNEKINQLLINLSDFLLSENNHSQKVRINLAGGEPTLYREQLLYTTERARHLGFDVSLITNASQLHNQKFSKNLLKNLSMIGISLDSSNIHINRVIGRETKYGQQISTQDIIEFTNTARANDPNLAIKINTVVNKLNYQDDMNQLIKEISPHRWKVLKMLPITNDRLSISDESFHMFKERHKQHQKIMKAESNDDMTESYVMIDPHGRFFQNSKKEKSGYLYSKSILKVGAQNAFKEVQFNSDKFFSRY